MERAKKLIPEWIEYDETIHQIYQKWRNEKNKSDSQAATSPKTANYATEVIRTPEKIESKHNEFNINTENHDEL